MILERWNVLNASQNNLKEILQHQSAMIEGWEGYLHLMSRGGALS